MKQQFTQQEKIEYNFILKLLTGAPILLLDECTSALDEETEKKLLTNLKRLKNKTCIIITHKKAALSICNKEVIIEDKKIVVKET